MFSSTKNTEMTQDEKQNAIQLECRVKSCGWYGFRAGPKRPRRIYIDKLEFGWTVWQFEDDSTIIWYNTYSESFQDEKPERSEYTRSCPGCKEPMKMTQPSQFCSRSCMYQNLYNTEAVEV